MLLNGIKDLGVFNPGDVVSTGIVAHCNGDYIFEIQQVGTLTTEVTTYAIGAALHLINNYNEAAEILFKIKVPQDPGCPAVDGFNYVTSADGAILFKFKSITSNC